MPSVLCCCSLSRTRLCSASHKQLEMMSAMLHEVGLEVWQPEARSPAARDDGVVGPRTGGPVWPSEVA